MDSRCYVLVSCYIGELSYIPSVNKDRKSLCPLKERLNNKSSYNTAEFVTRELVSIIIPAYQEELRIERCLKSILAELLVMDEATAALDMETEKAVIDSIRQVKEK